MVGILFCENYYEPYNSVFLLIVTYLYDIYVYIYREREREREREILLMVNLRNETKYSRCGCLI